jgi:uncharacterized protein
MWKLILITILGISSMATAETIDLQTFRKEREDSLKKNWLVVSGLTWLKEGDNSVGSDKKSDVNLPKTTPEHLGRLIFKNKKVTMIFSAARFKDYGAVTLNGKNVVAEKKYNMLPDTTGKETTVDIGGVNFHVIERPNGFGIRIKDPNAETLKEFKGLNWWPEKKNFIVEGKWHEIKPEKTLRVPDVLGNVTDEKIDGSVQFSINGEKYELFPTRDKDDLFFVFKDLTAGKTSYGTGRFLTAKIEHGGKVILDFNRAYNPPCAQILYATCPVPPAENALKVAIEAGEKAPNRHH